MTQAETLSRIRNHARTADELRQRSGKLRVDCARSGAATGVSQRQISEAMRGSQPEVSRLLRFHRRTVLGQTLELHRRPILKLLASAEARNVRVFGSASRGEDGPDSEIDLLGDFAKPVSLFSLSRLEAAATAIVNVDVVPSASLRANVAACRGRAAVSRTDREVTQEAQNNFAILRADSSRGDLDDQTIADATSLRLAPS